MKPRDLRLQLIKAEKEKALAELKVLSVELTEARAQVDIERQRFTTLIEEKKAALKTFEDKVVSVIHNEKDITFRISKKEKELRDIEEKLSKCREELACDSDTCGKKKEEITILSEAVTALKLRKEELVQLVGMQENKIEDTKKLITPLTTQVDSLTIDIDTLNKEIRVGEAELLSLSKEKGALNERASYLAEKEQFIAITMKQLGIPYKPFNK